MPVVRCRFGRNHDHGMKICFLGFCAELRRVGKRWPAILGLLLGFAISASAVDHSAAVLASQEEAMRRYPELAVRNSKFNALFLARVKDLQISYPDYFKANDWPGRLADECAQKMQQVLATGGAASRVSASNDTAKAAGSFNQSEVTSTGGIKSGGDVQAPSKETEKTSGTAKLSDNALIGIILLIALLALFVLKRIFGRFFRIIMDLFGLRSVVDLADYVHGSHNSDSSEPTRQQETDEHERERIMQTRKRRGSENQNSHQQRERDAQDRRCEGENRMLKQQQDRDRARIDQQKKKLAQEEAHSRNTHHSNLRPFIISFLFNNKPNEEVIMATDRYTAIKLFKFKYPHLTFRSARDG